jgi:hypothetical protein
LPNSADSPPSEPRRRTAATLAVIALLSLAAACSAAWFFRHGYLLYYGDAQSHLNISRTIIDSRTPGYDQLGNVWLPVLHVICLPFVANDWLWHTGLAGTIPVALCLVVAGTFFYLAARETYGSALAAAVVLSCLVLNPNLLYLASIPMTEVVFLAGLAVLLFALLRFRATQKSRFVALALAASWWMSLTRYDGWFLIPFAAIWLWAFAASHRWLLLFIFGALATLAPLYWIAHNWWETGNALDFFNGPYSARAIQASQPYPGSHDWKLALLYYSTAGKLCAGSALFWLGAAGLACAAIKKKLAPLLFLLLTPVFYVWSMHSSASTPIFVPPLWPYTYYNSRYGIAIVAVSAFAAGAIVLVLPMRWRKVAFLLPLISIAPWFMPPSKENWICWKESQVNSIARRAWTASAADFFSRHYQSGQGILTASGTGDIAGVFCRAAIPLRELIYFTTDATWWANKARPDLLHQALWAVAQPGDPIGKTLARPGQPYLLTDQIQVPKAPPLEIYERTDPGAPR